MGFSRQEYWSGLPFHSPGDLPDPGTEPRSPALQADALTSATREDLVCAILQKWPVHFSNVTEPTMETVKMVTINNQMNTLRGFPGGPVGKCMLTMKGAQVKALVRKLDPACMPQLLIRSPPATVKTPWATAKTQHRQNKYFWKINILINISAYLVYLWLCH